MSNNPRPKTYKLHASDHTANLFIRQELGNVVCRLANLANTAARELTGSGRAWAYRMKCEALSALILTGSASVNGVRPNGTLGLDICADPPFRLHVPLRQLGAQAQSAVKEQLASAPAVAPLGERWIIKNTQSSEPLQ